MRVFSPTSAFGPGSVASPVPVEVFLRIIGDHLTLSLEGPADVNITDEGDLLILTEENPTGTFRLVFDPAGPVQIYQVA